MPFSANRPDLEATDATIEPPRVHAEPGRRRLSGVHPLGKEAICFVFYPKRILNSCGCKVSAKQIRMHEMVDVSAALKSSWVLQ